MKAIRFLLVPLLVLMSAGQAHAACEGSKRIKQSESSCFEGAYQNKSPWYYFGYTKGSAQAFNTCSRTGKLVVKVDRQAAEDWTWTIESPKKRSKSGGARIRGIYCCADLSDEGVCQDD
ncbi:MAG: hypothetical protein ERJ67_07935 [Aphanocapsa feldmannii 277cV]|uniref:Uncharacterized protein n=1 Tax=Aphanocapsa feldmannii 277cV TaxID=2507553 RepID=A0A524RMB8_9CHRO|nr:MAG: hypothetical protein ERJ67_07935 [Aphanocapsa feldmannii 277cV]